MLGKASAILNELRLRVRLRSACRRERKALVRLGEETAAAGPPDDSDLLQVLAQVRQGSRRVKELQSAVTNSLAADREDYTTVSPLVRPVVVLRGLCIRAVLRHQVAVGRRALIGPQEAIGTAVANRPLAFARHPELVKAVVDAGAELRVIRDQHTSIVAMLGGSVFPTWFPKLRRESEALGRALWIQLRPTVLPRGSALAGLAVGWWLGNTYTDSHLRSFLNSLGLGHGGRHVVSGQTYRAMMFWLPLLAAALFAYLADRAQLLIQRRYDKPTPPP